MRGHETRGATPDHRDADDEKTIRDDIIIDDLREEKKDSDDQEKGSRSRSCSESVSVSQQEPVVAFDDDYPDGGLRAWMVVLGVGDLISTRI